MSFTCMLHYVCSTPDIGPTVNFAQIAQSAAPPRLCAFADASFACHPNKDSQGAFVFCFGPYGPPVDVKTYTFNETVLNACQGANTRR